MTEFEKDLQQENTYPEMRKGFKGFWWNFFNCGKLSKEDQKKVKRKLLIGGGTALAGIVMLCLAITFLLIFIENAAPYSQVKVETFRRNWNALAGQETSAITMGIEIGKKEVSDSYNTITLSEGRELSIDRTRNDIEALTYTCSDYGTSTEHAKIIEELLALCLPGVDYSQKIGEYVEEEKKYVVGALRGVKIEFLEAESKEEIDFKINAVYEYTPNIIACDQINGCVFDVTMDAFIDAFNNKMREYYADAFGEAEIADMWKITAPEYVIQDENGKSISQYRHLWKELASVYIGVDDASGKIISIEYQVVPLDNITAQTDIQVDLKETLQKRLPLYLCFALGYGEQGYGDSYIEENYFKLAEASDDHSHYERGVALMRGRYVQDDGNTFDLTFICACTKEHYEKMLSGEEVTGSAESNKTTPDDKSQTPTEHTFLVKNWSGAASDNLSLSINVAEFDSTYKIKGLLTLSDNKTNQKYTQDLDLSPDGEGNYYKKISADQEYELWFSIKDEQNIECTLYWESGASASFSLNQGE